MRIQKKLKWSALLLSVLLITGACNEEGDPVIDDTTLDEITSEAMVEFAMEDAENIALDNMDALLSGGNSSAADFNGRFNPYGGRTDCATVTRDEVAQTITIDFGDGCSNGDGIERSGIIHISYTDRRNEPGAVITTTFDNFQVNGNQIEGTRTLTNISDDTPNQRAFQVTVEGGQITFEDGTSRTFESSKVRTHAIEESSNELTVTVEGTQSGVNREGISYSMSITEPLTYTNSCRQVGVRVAVSGTREITRDGETTTIDYGDGACDNLATVTRPDGIVEEVTITHRRRRG